MNRWRYEYMNVFMSAKSFQSCPALCNPMDYSPPGSFVYGILQARNWSGLPCSPPGDFIHKHKFVYKSVGKFKGTEESLYVLSNNYVPSS